MQLNTTDPYCCNSLQTEEENPLLYWCVIINNRETPGAEVRQKETKQVHGQGRERGERVERGAKMLSELRTQTVSGCGGRFSPAALLKADSRRQLTHMVSRRRFSVCEAGSTEYTVNISQSVDKIYCWLVSVWSPGDVLKRNMMLIFRFLFVFCASTVTCDSYLIQPYFKQSQQTLSICLVNQFFNVLP